MTYSIVDINYEKMSFRYGAIDTSYANKAADQHQDEGPIDHVKAKHVSRAYGALNTNQAA